MDYWLKTLGGGGRGALLRDDWQEEANGLLLRAATFPRRPGVRTGDGIVYYGAGYQVVFAAGYATSLPYQAESSEDTNWPWRVNVSLPWMVEFIHEGTPVDHLNVGDRDLGVSLKRRSHIRLTREEYEAAVNSLGGTP
jgi:hypothetical protein